MKLISCDNCGIVRDADRVRWPEVYVGEGAIWDGDEYVPTIECVCGYHIDEEGNTHESV